MMKVMDTLFTVQKKYHFLNHDLVNAFFIFAQIFPALVIT